MICSQCGKRFRVVNVVAAADVSKRQVCCEGCGRQAYSVEQIYAERTPRAGMYKSKAKKITARSDSTTRSKRTH